MNLASEYTKLRSQRNNNTSTQTAGSNQLPAAGALSGGGTLGQIYGQLRSQRTSGVTSKIQTPALTKDQLEAMGPETFIKTTNSISEGIAEKEAQLKELEQKIRTGSENWRKSSNQSESRYYAALRATGISQLKQMQGEYQKIYGEYEQLVDKYNGYISAYEKNKGIFDGVQEPTAADYDKQIADCYDRISAYETLETEYKRLNGIVNTTPTQSRESQEASARMSQIYAQVQGMDDPQILTAKIEELERDKVFAEKYRDLYKQDDFAQLSKYEPENTGRKRNGMEIVAGNYSDDNSGWKYPLYEAVNGNKEAQSWIVEKAAQTYGGNGNPLASIMGRISHGKSEMKYLDPDEVAIFNYLYHTKGIAAAEEFYNALRPGLLAEQRQAQEKSAAAYAQEHPVLASIGKIVASPTKVLSYVSQLADYLGDGEMEKDAAYNQFIYKGDAVQKEVAQKVEQKWGKAGSFAYNTGMSMGEFLFSAAVSGGNSALSLGIMGTGAAADTTLDALDRGLNSGQAMLLGTIAGATEILTEKISIDALLDKTGLGKNALGYILQNTLAEGSEEGVSGVANLIADIMISKDKSQWQKSIDAYKEAGLDETKAFWKAVGDQALQIGLDVLGGALSGAAMGGGSATISAGSAAITGSKLKGAGISSANAAELIEAGLTGDRNGRAYYLAQQMQAKLDAGKKLTDYDLGRMFQANAAENLQMNLTPNLGMETNEKTAQTGGDVQLKDMQVNATKEMMSEARQLSAATGRKIVLFTETATDNGINDGYHENGVLYINTESQNPFAVNVGHELTHSIEQTAQWDSLKKIVLDRIDRTPGRLEQMRKAKRDLYAKNGVELENDNQIDREIVASYMASTLLTDAKSIQELVNTDRKVGQRIRDWLNDILIKMGSDNAFIRRARSLYAEALRQTQGSFQQQATAAGAVQSRQADANADFDSMSLEQMRQWALDAYAAGQISEETLQQIQEGIDEQADMEGREISPEAELKRIGMSDAQFSISPAKDAIDLSKDNELSRRVAGVRGSAKYKIIQDYILEVLGDQPITLSDGKQAIVDRSDALHIANKTADKKSAYISEIKRLVETAELFAEETEAEHDKFDYFCYYKVDVKYDGEVFPIFLNVGKGRYDGQYHIYDITQKIRDTADRINGLGRPVGNALRNGISTDSIRRDSQNVKQHSISSIGEGVVKKADVISSLRTILAHGGDSAALRQYVASLEQNAGNPEQSNENAYQNNAFAERNNGFAHQKAETAEQILAAAKAQEISVEEYLEQNWEHYDVNGQWNAEARKALEQEERTGRRQYSISDNRMTDAEIQAVQNIGRKSVNAFDQADIQATERFAHKYWKEMGVKSPFFRAWFGDWRANDHTPVQIATQKGDTRGVQKNTDTGWNIQVSGKVFNETRVHTESYNIAARKYLPYINSIVEKAVLLDSYGLDTDKPKSTNSLLMHSLYVVADAGGGPELLKLYVEEMNDPNEENTSKRAYQLQNVEKYQLTGKSSQKTDSSISPVTTGTIQTVADLFDAVKRLDKEFNPKPASKVVNEDGTPKVVYHGSEEMFTAFSYGHIGKSTGVGILGQGFYFTDKKKLAKNYGSNLFEVYLQIENPYMATETDAYKIDVPQLEAQGYDGVILSTPSGKIYMVFNNAQIKSATENVGTFDGTNPDIQYSISEPAAEATEGGATETTNSVETVNREYSVDETVNPADTAGTDEEIRSRLPRKAQRYLKRAERTLLNSLCQTLSVPYYARRNFLQPMVEEISGEYLRNGTVSEETITRLFDKAYEEGVVVDREFYDENVEIKRFLQKNPITLDPRNRADIADYDDFRKRNRYTLRIKEEGGLPVDVAYQELNGMSPYLFPENITHPADQLVRMADVADSVRIAEKSLEDYYKHDPDFKKWAKHEFASSVDGITAELWRVKRYHDDRLSEDSELAPETPEEAEKVYVQIKAARRVYEKALAKNLLTEHDDIQLGRLIRGEIELQHLDPEVDNVAGITAVYEAKVEYADLLRQIAAYNRKRRAALRETADSLLQTANDWEDKHVGLAYMRETMVRNIEDIVPDPELAKQINAEYFEKIAISEAEATRLKDNFRDKVRELKLSRKVQKGNAVSEAHAVQLLGEAQDNIRMLEKSKGRTKQRDGLKLSDWQAAVDNLWLENPGLDKVKIQNAVLEFRKIYDELFRMMNTVRIRNGYEPINYRNGYFPHFQPGDGDGVLAQFGKILGIDTKVEALPTTINGLTHTFKPGIQWFGNAQERLGFNTAYDAVEGFDKYIEGAASVICQTDNIQKLRAFASQARYRTSEPGIQEQVDDVLMDNTLTEDEKQAVISQIYERGRFALSNFVTELDEYTNLLANKKSRLDRTVEALLGRRVYTFMKDFESRVGANMVAGNISSALTNFIPLVQAASRMDRGTLLRGMWETLKAYKTGDGLVEMSDFLTNRRGSDPLIRTWVQKGSNIVGKPMEFVDCFAADSIVRGAYYQNLKRGMTSEDAMYQADLFAARVMADRSKGAMPTLFSSMNPALKIFTQFQLEVNNQFSEVFKDIPRAYREKGMAVLVGVLFKYFLGSWLFNDLFEALFGRRPALDPIGLLNDTAGDYFGYALPNTFEMAGDLIAGKEISFKTEKRHFGEATKSLVSNTLSELPFASALTLFGAEIDGGRIPVSSAVPNFADIWDAISTPGWGSEKRMKEIGDELAKLMYVIPPFMGGQLLKSAKGIVAAVSGGSYSVDAQGNPILQYPVYDDVRSVVQAMILGKNSLPEAQEWVNSGFDSLNAKQTAAFQDIVAIGEDPREIFTMLKDWKALEPLPGKMQVSDGQYREFLLKTAISADAKKIMVGMMMGTDLVNGEGKPTQYAKFLSALDTGMDVDDYLQYRNSGGEIDKYLELYAAGMKASEAAEFALGLDSLKPAEGKKQVTETQKRKLLLESKMSEKSKIAAIGVMLGTDMETESGKPSQYARFASALDSGMDANEYLQFRIEGGDVENYLDLREAGVDKQQAIDLAIDLEELEPLDGEDRVITVQRWQAAVDSSTDPEEQLAALSTMMRDAEFDKVRKAYDYGIKPATYVHIAAIKRDFDDDENGSYTQKEIEAAIDALNAGYDNPLLAMTGNAVTLTMQQKAILWQLLTGAKTAKNNPYGAEYGQMVVG